MDLVLKKSRSPIYLQSAQRLSNSPKLILDSSDAALDPPKDFVTRRPNGSYWKLADTPPLMDAS